jgi:protein-tyrosine phosphatase
VSGESGGFASHEMEGSTVVERAEPGAGKGDIFSILIVCTGNVCRSPLAEQLLTARLSEAGIPVRVESAGTRALVGRGMPEEVTALSLDYGGDPSGHLGRQVTPEMVEDADLILTATRDHRGEIVSLSPAASRHTFTLQQFARISQASETRPLLEPVVEHREAPGARSALVEYVATVAASRGYAPPPARAIDDDIEDPFRQSKQVYRRVARTIDEAVTSVVEALASAVPRR